ncbi:MAG: hypothetical protein IJM92_14920 [Fibrobacter sp.]|uniref:hypothetical protein n=1 Tax=Fibrobacter sp. TaxID=35828 RepID=UPI0025C000DC|nr:hypothetical protein [Fibrobacter sp.]MBQ3720537.1 hypothetical protein [Fibrobacter sp.]MBQ7080913.1 hypothetical protein [Fibrobacter sp.]
MINDKEVKAQLNQSLSYNYSEDALINEKISLKSTFPDLSEEDLDAMAKENLSQSTKQLNEQRQSIKEYPLQNEESREQ